jgi:hypothetical protein
MRARFYFVPLAFAAVCGVAAHAQIVSYTFGSSGSPSSSATTVAGNVSASSFASNLGSGATSSGSPGSLNAGGGGGSYFVSSNWRAVDGNYFYFTITPAAGYQITLSDFSFYYAATSTGPNSASLTSSADNYGSALGNFALTRQAGGSLLASDWHAANSSITMTAISSATIFRVNATGASASTGALRIDAVTLNGTVSAVPEPATYAAISGAIALLGVIVSRRRKKSSATVAEDSVREA